ncbi:CsbD family protein [Bacteriovorax sp. PP10]|uniref:CsbD family protein n=1 Tax=Bacteriovorax antarcticus TaxID=3088717 RepID=A0ABU5VS32_9BACT|nr:CsbD family protein [Bacteriovorax sp. PP10]MEA9355722.1 CsbD family protein [Bacteriovorax sp. PP10]
MTFKDLDNASSTKSNYVLNEDTLKGKWKEAKGEIQKMWGKLTDDDLEKAKGDMTALTGIIQQRYGESKESVQTKLNDYFGNAWADVKQGVASTAEKAKNAVAEASESAKQKL